MSDELEMMRCMYEANAEMRRHHEDKREKVTQLIVVMGGALLGWISSEHFAKHTTPVALFLVGLGLFGWLISKKHYERSRRHIKIADCFRAEIDKRLPTAKLNTTWSTAVAKHDKEFPFTSKVRLNWLWDIFSLLICVSGVACLIYIWFHRQ